MQLVAQEPSAAAQTATDHEVDNDGHWSRISVAELYTTIRQVTFYCPPTLKEKGI